MVHNPHTPNHPDKPVKKLNPAEIRQTRDEKGRTVITIPDGECPDSLGHCIEMSTGRPLNGGPLYIVGA
jgi:hypothetical protein